MKLKTHRGLKKRVKVTAGKKIFFKKANKKHLLINKSKDQKGMHQSGMPAHKANVPFLRKLLGFG